MFRTTLLMVLAALGVVCQSAPILAQDNLPNQPQQSAAATRVFRHLLSHSAAVAAELHRETKREGSMGLFDFFRKPKPAEPLPQLCYDVAYFILPHYAFNDVAKVAYLCSNTPTAAGPFFYVMACQMRKVEPNMEDAQRFRWHHGQLDEQREYFALEYPVPPPVDLSDASPEQLMSGGGAFVLAPHFSTIIREGGTGEISYFILGQAPMGGGTTLRCVLREGANCNLGPGPEPQLASFLDAVRERGRA